MIMFQSYLRHVSKGLSSSLPFYSVYIEGLCLAKPNHTLKRFKSNNFASRVNQQQARILARFTEEIEDTMKKIKTNQKVKTNRRRKHLSQTTNILFNIDKNLTPSLEESNIPSGSPEQLVMRRDGMSKAFLTTRMKIFNTNFTRAISEIFIADEEISTKVEEYKIRLTQVRATSNCKILNIYWVSDTKDIDKKVIADYLNTIKGRIHELLIEAQNFKSIPWLTFVYDLQTSYNDEIELRLNKCKEDLVEDGLKNDSTIQNDLEDNFKYKNLTSNISWNDFVEEINYDDYFKKAIQCSNNDIVYKSLKLKMPDDMDLYMFNLDYEFLMNKVLQNMHRSRAQHRKTTESYQNSVSEHLPFLDMTNCDNSSSPVDYNTEERIKAMKKFLFLNKKRKSKLDFKLKRMILQEEINRFESYEQLKQTMEERMANIYDEQQVQSDDVDL